MVRKFFESYLEAKNWLNIYEYERERFFNSLPYTSPPGISYEEFTSRSATTHDERMAIIADEMKKYDDDRIFLKNTSEIVVASCDKWIEEIDKECRQFFVAAFMEEERTLEEVGNIVGYSAASVYRKIVSECNRLFKK